MGVAKAARTRGAQWLWVPLDQHEDCIVQVELGKHAAWRKIRLDFHGLIRKL